MSKTRDSDRKPGATIPRARAGEAARRRVDGAHRTAAGQRGVIDTGEFTRSDGRLEGVESPEQFERLDDLLYDLDGRIAWQVSGHRLAQADGSRQPWLKLVLHAELDLECTRCLQQLPVVLDETRDFLLVSDEALAARVDSVDDDHDVLVGSQEFDLLELVEDETIMLLPLVPRHEHCDLPVTPETATDTGPVDASAAASSASGAPDAGEADEPSRPNPFAALAALRKPGPK